VRPTQSTLLKRVLFREILNLPLCRDLLTPQSSRYGEGAVLGGDFCGRVEQIGSDVTRVKPGDRVGGLLRLGAYATHIVAEERFCFKVPEAVSSEAAATLPLALDTAWLALFSPYSLGLDRIIKGDKTQLLIWGASTSVGQYAIQILKHFGFEFAVTCSKPELVKDLGAKHVFDYRSPTVVEDIKKTLPNITHVFDCVATETSSKQASGAVCEACGLLCTVAPGKRNTEHIESRVKATDVIVWTAFFTELNYGPVHLPVRKTRGRFMALADPTAATSRGSRSLGRIVRKSDGNANRGDNQTQSSPHSRRRTRWGHKRLPAVSQRCSFRAEARI